MPWTTRRISRLLALGIFLVAATCAPLTAQEATGSSSTRQPMTVEDLWAMARVSEPALSPDGKLSAFSVTRFSMETNTRTSHLWIAPTDRSSPARQLTHQGSRNTSPRFSPDGASIAFLSRRGDVDAMQLFTLALDGGEARQVTDLPIAVVDMQWLPDSKGMIFVARTWPDLDDDMEAVGKRLAEQRDDKVQARISEDRAYRYWDRYTTDGRVAHFFHLDLAGGAVTDLTPSWSRRMNFRSAAGEWDMAPDGSEITLSANATDPPYQTLNFDLFRMTLERTAEGALVSTGITNITAGNPADDFRPRYGPDGSFLIYGHRTRPEIDSDFTRLARLDTVTGESIPLTSGTLLSPQGWAISGDGGTLFFHAQSYGKTHLHAMPAGGGDHVVLAEGGVTSGVATGPGGPQGLVVYRTESITQPPELMVLRNDGRPGERLTHFHDERLAALDLGSVEDVTFRGHDDDPVQMWVVYPPGFTPKKDWPLLQVIHGGPHGASQDRWHTRWNLALFASTGAVVTAVNFHGSTGFGQRFADSILGNHAEKPFQDVMLATDYMLGRGYIDRDRVLAAGGSYGGYLVAWILGHTDRFAALINHAGVYDLRSQYASDWTWGRSNNYGATPWEDPDRIDRYTPSRFAAGFDTPTLILHGEKDYRVPVQHGLELHGVLTAKGVRSRLVVFPEENHWILTPQGARLWWNEVFSWMRQYGGTRQPR